MWTILFTVVAYGAIALGFWCFFRQRRIRHERYKVRAQDLYGPPTPAVDAEAAPGS